jgi:hypothetical protein
VTALPATNQRDTCTTCKADRPKYARWFYVYPDIAPLGQLTPIAIYCRTCVPIGVYAESLVHRSRTLMAEIPAGEQP